MRKFYLKERISFDMYGNCIRGTFRFHNVKDSSNKTLYFDNVDDAFIHKHYLQSLSNQYEYKICTKEV